VIQRGERQLFRHPFAAYGGQEVHLLQFTDIRFAALERGDAAAAHHLAILLNHPVGVTRLAVEGIQLIKIRIGHGIAFVGGQAILR